MQTEAKPAAKGGHSLTKLVFLLGAVMLLLRLWRAQRATDFRGRVIVITGGSRGLGLALARQLVQEDAKVALLARDVKELDRAARQLDGLGGEVLTVPCDITNETQARIAIEAVLDRFGAIDGLINNAGTIQVGPMEHMAKLDYEEAMNLHLWAPLRLINLAVPHMKRQGGGRIVNIASFGGLIAMPHMTPYSVTKFAEVGLSNAMRAELFKDGVLVTTVCPGVIRTGSHVQANFKGRQTEEYTMFKLAGVLPGTPDAATAARLILDAMRHGDPQLTFPLQMRLAHMANALFPNTAGFFLGVLNRFMPAPAEESGGDRSISGREVENMIPQSVLSKLNLRAVLENNQANGNGHSLEKASEN